MIGRRRDKRGGIPGLETTSVEETSIPGLDNDELDRSVLWWMIFSRRKLNFGPVRPQDVIVCRAAPFTTLNRDGICLNQSQELRGKFQAAVSPEESGCCEAANAE